MTIPEDLIEGQTIPTIAPYAGKFEVMLRLTANGATEEECTELLDGMELLHPIASGRDSSMDMEITIHCKK